MRPHDIRTTSAIALTLALVWFISFITLTQTIWARPLTDKTLEMLNFTDILHTSDAPAPALQSMVMRDQYELQVRMYGDPKTAERILILLHGSGWHGLQFNELATALAQESDLAVIVPDLRGHGTAPGRRGDVDYVGQLEDDVADLIHDLTSGRSDQTVVVGGHSSGGGLALRFASGEDAEMVDRLVLLAPYLGHDAPTTRPRSGGWATPAVPRIIGLSLLNRVGITALNHLPVISFAMPEAVLNGPLGHTATTSYSYRLHVSYAPRDYADDLRNVTVPTLLVVGEHDEAFIASAYEPLLRQLMPMAAVQQIAGAGHLNLVIHPHVPSLIADWLR